MDWIIVAGSLCLGVLIGAIVAWYFSAAQETGLTVPVLAGAISALVGSSVLAMFSFLAGFRGPTSEYWFYPVRLLVGFTAIMIVEYMHYDYYGKPRKSRK